MLLVGIAVNALASVGIGVLTFISTDSELRGHILTPVVLELKIGP